MAYQVKYTETTNPAKPSITVEDQTLNTETSVTFVGKNYAGYAPVIAENFLHLLENFARNTAPGTQTGDGQPVEGQLWYDNSPGTTLLKVYDGTSWKEVGSVKKIGRTALSGGSPSALNSTKGDLWVDTDNQQLYLYSGSSWLLVGPQFSSGTKTGPQIETIVDIDNVERNVLTLFAEDQRIAIISNVSFTPKVTTLGFTTINKGVNLTSVDSLSTTSPTKFWGTASQADALVVNGAVVSAGNFLRTDDSSGSTSNVPINIRNGAGLTIGSDLSFNIGTDINTTVLYSKTSGNSVDIRLTNAGVPVTVLHVDASARVGIGENNTNPTEALDVAGNIVSDGIIKSLSSVDSSSPTTGSIISSGGLGVLKSSNFGGNINSYGKIFVNNLDNVGSPTSGAVILPGYTSDSAEATAQNVPLVISPLYDIGSTSRRFRNIYADSFVGNFSGTFTGNLNGSISGEASKLASPTVFRIRGDVSSEGYDISFDGQTTTGQVTFQTSITQDLITAKPAITDSLQGDQLLVYRTGAGLRKISKQTFVSNIPTVPVGSLLPYAGLTPPAGYLLCDGSEVLISKYSELFAIIGYTYKTPSLLRGLNTFALPDLRGRFPLGRDNMDNGIQVPSKDSASVLIDAGGGSSNRVTDVVADTLGAGSGAESRTLEVRNLPDHRHSLNSGIDQYYAAGRPGAAPDANAIAGYGMPNTSTGYGFPNSGGVISSTTSTPVATMNPYLTINYIIFTGAL